MARPLVVVFRMALLTSHFRIEVGVSAIAAATELDVIGLFVAVVVVVVTEDVVGVVVDKV